MKLKKIICGLLAGAGLFSSGVSKGHSAVKSVNNLDNIDIVNSNSKENLKKASNWKNELENLGIGPAEYVPNEKIEALDLDSSKEFETQNLIIEKLTDKEVASLVNIYDNYVYERISDAGHAGQTLTDRDKLNGIRQYIKSNEDTKICSYIVKAKIMDEKTKTMKVVPAGEVTIYHEPGNHSFNLSFWFGKDFRGKGYASELIPTICKKMFARNDIDNMYFRILDSNGPSLRIKNKTFAALENMYPNQVLNINTLPFSDDIHIYMISKSYFDICKAVDQGYLITIDSMIDQTKSMLANWDTEYAKYLPSDAKEKMEKILDKMIKEKEKCPLTFSMQLGAYGEHDVTLRIPSADSSELLFFSNPALFDEKNKDLLGDMLNSKDWWSAEKCIYFASIVLCGSTINKVELKFHDLLKKPNLFQDLDKALKKDPSSKILKLNLEKDEKGEEHIYLSKKN